MLTVTWTEKRALRLAGIVSVLATLLMITADELEQYTPKGYGSYLNWQDISAWRLFAGTLLGVLAIPLSIIGYWQVCRALKLSGVKRTTWLFWLIAYGIVLGTVGHGGIAGFMVLIQQASLAQATDYLQTYVAIPFGFFLLCYFVTSAWFMIIVLSRRTLYPKWMAFLSPGLLSLIIALLNVSNMFPVLANVLAPAWLSIAHLVFFTASTLVLWNPERASEREKLAREQSASST